GTPMQSQLSYKGYNGVYFAGRNDLGRTNTLSQFDLFLQHDVHLFRNQRFNVNVNVANLFDQSTVTNFNASPWRDTFNGFPFGATTDATGSDKYFFNGFDPYALAAA